MEWQDKEECLQMPEDGFSWDIREKFFHHWSTSEALAQVARRSYGCAVPVCVQGSAGRCLWAVLQCCPFWRMPDSPGIPGLLPGFPGPGCLRPAAGSAAARGRHGRGGGSRRGGDTPLPPARHCGRSTAPPWGAAPAPSAGGGLNGAFKLLLTPLSRLPKISINKPLELNGSKTKSSFKCIYPFSFLSFKC